MSDVSAEYLVLLDHLQIVKYCRVAPAALWLLDYCLTFGDEVDLVWNKNISPFCLVNTLYIVARYFPLVGLITGTYDILGQNMDLLTCTGLNGTSDLIPPLVTIATETLLFKRTLCLLHSHKKFKALLAVTYITACIILLSCTIRVMLFGYTDICTQQSSASKSASRDQWTAGTYVAIAFFELSVVIMTLYHGDIKPPMESRESPNTGQPVAMGQFTITKQFTTSKHTTTARQPIATALRQGNLVYAFPLLTVSSVNLAFYSFPITLDEGWLGLFSAFQLVLHGIMGTRVMFELRLANNKNKVEIDETISPIVFNQTTLV